MVLNGGVFFSRQIFGYYSSGADAEHTLRDNLAAYTRYKLMPRYMVDVSNVDTSTTLLGEAKFTP